MAKLKKNSKDAKLPQKKGAKRSLAYSKRKQQYIKKVGLQIVYDLEHGFDEPRPIEWLSWEAGVSRSSLREIMAGRQVAKWITLLSIAEALGYESLSKFLDEAMN